MSYPCSRHCPKAGLTLIEVSVSLALVSTLLVGIMTAMYRHERQIRAGKRRLDAANKVDMLLYGWMAKGGAVPRASEGGLPDSDGLVWQTQVFSREHRRDLGIDIVRLQVFATEDPSGERRLVLALDLPVASPAWPAPTETP